MKATTKERPGFMMYHDLLPQVEMMSPDEAGELLRALLVYSSTGSYDTVPRTVELILLGYIPRIDRDARRYEEKLRRCRKAAKARWEKAHAAEAASKDTEASDSPGIPEESSKAP